MRIGLVISQLRNGGGAYQLLHLAQELKKINYSVTIYTLFDSMSELDPVLVKGLAIKSCHFTDVVEKKPHGQIVGFILYLKYLFKINYTLYSLIKNERLDILNCHEWPMQWTGAMIKIKKRIPVVWTCNDVWHIHSYRQYSESRLIFRLADRTLIQMLDMLFTLFTDKITVLDKRIMSILSSHYHKEVVLVRSGIDKDEYVKIPSKAEARKRIGLSSSSLIFLCLSIFFPHRRFEDAVEAFNRLKEKYQKNKMELLILGSDKYDPAYSKKIKNLIYKLNLQRNVFIKTNYVPPDILKLYLAACDIFIFPNEKQTWGLAVVEAMACGKPCIVSSEAGVHEIIENNKNGLIFEVRDTKDLESKMEDLAFNSKKREEIGKKARNYVFKNISWSKYGKQMADVFNSVKV